MPVQTEAQRQATFAAAGQQPAPSTPPVAPVAPPAPGTTDYAAKLEEARQTALKIKSGIDALAASEKPAITSNSYVSSSLPIVNQEKSVTDAIAALSTPSPTEQAAKDASENYMKVLQQQYDALEARRAKEIETIEKNFEATKRSTEDAQNRETGTTNVAITRVGGYLGTQISGVGVLNNLALSHRQEIGTLEAKKAAAINEANNAITDKQFDIARLKAAEVKDISKEINDRRNKFFDQSMQIIQEQRAQEAATGSKVQDQLKTLSGGDPATISPQIKAEIDAYYKSPGFADKYFSSAQAAATAKSQQEVFDAHKKYVDLLQALPTGQKLQLPDGSTITGIGKTSDVEVFNKEDANGRVTIVSFNKGTGAVKEYDAGNIGTPASARNGEDEVINRFAPVVEAFDAIEKDSEGYIAAQVDSSAGITRTPSQIFNNMYNVYQKENPGKGSEFISNFKQYLPPADRKIMGL